MKNYLLLIMTFCFVVSINAQDKLYVNLWYGKVKNENVEKHLELEEKFFSKYHKERIKNGDIVGWDMWQIVNPAANDMTTTFVYSHLTTSLSGGNNPSIDKLEGISAGDWRGAQIQTSRNYVRNYQVLVSLKGGYGPQANGTPPPVVVLNYMDVKPYKAAEYEKMELETFMPAHKEAGLRKGWGLHKVLNHYGSEQGFNYITADFYDDLETVYNNIDQTSPLGDDQVKNLQAMDEIRDLKRAHIMKLVKSVR